MAATYQPTGWAASIPDGDGYTVNLLQAAVQPGE